jgi:nicotinamidase/pyrazinamidase
MALASIYTHFEFNSRITLILLPKKTQIAAFDVDAQRTFTPLCPDELPVAGGDQIAPELNAQAQFAAWRIGSKDAHCMQAHWLADAAHPPLTKIDGVNMDLRWPAHAIVGTNGFELLESLPRPAEYDYFVWKGVEPDMHPYGACYHDLQDRMSTGVIEFLRAQQVRFVLVGGLALDYCVATTALQLQRAGFTVIVNLAACRGIAEPSCAQAQATLQAAGVQLIASVAQLQQQD